MKRFRILGLFLFLGVGAVLSVIGGKWIHYRITHAITNAVFVESDSFTKVAYKRLNGRIVKLFKEEGERVRKGEPLAKIEDRDLKLKLQEIEKHKERLQKEIEALIEKKRTLKKEILGRIEIARMNSLALAKEIEALSAKIDQLSRDKRRLEDLHKKGVIPLREFEKVETELKVLRRKKESLKMNYKIALKERDVLLAKLEQLRELDKKTEALKKELEALEKKEEDLRNMIEETILKSPVEGYVLKRFVSVGEVIRQGQFVYALYDPKDIYLLVLLEETKLRGVKEGNRVFIKIDAFPDEKFEGVVEEIGRAVASKFALIPRDITAGEFTKVVQRIPLKVKIVKGNKDLLRIGMGGEVAIEKSGK